MKATDQTATEAAKGAYEDIQDSTDDRPTLEILNEHFKYAIEKAYEQGFTDAEEKAAAELKDVLRMSRAAHAS